MKTHITREKGSITLGMVYGLGLLSLGIASLALSSVVTNLSTHKNEMSGVRTFVTADSAAREGVYQVLKDAGYTTGSDIEANFITATNDTSSLSPGIVRVRGNAMNQLTERNVVYEVLLPVSEAAFDQAIYSYGNLRLGGSLEVTGNVYAGGNITINGNPTVDGAVDASGTVVGSSNRFSEAPQVQQPVLTPPVIDLLWYKQQAITDGTYYTSASAVASLYDGAVMPAGKIIYVADPNHDLKLNNANTVLKGTLVVEGRLTLNNISVSPGESPYDSPLVVYVGDTLQMQGSTAIEGLVYTHYTEAATGNSTIVGSLYVVNADSEPMSTGNLTVTYDPSLALEYGSIEGLNLQGSILLWKEI